MRIDKKKVKYKRAEVPQLQTAVACHPDCKENEDREKCSVASCFFSKKHCVGAAKGE